MASAYHVNGPAIFKVGTGVNAALEVLGVCEEGIDINITPIYAEVKSDAAGEGGVAEMQKMNDVAEIRGRLIAYDESVFQKIKSHGLTDGLALPPGTLMGTGGYAFKLVIPSDDLPWRFPKCLLRGNQAIRLGTKYTVPQITFFAWRYLPGTATTVNNVALYDHTDA